MNKLSVMTLGFVKETVLPFRKDGDISALKSRYQSLFAEIRRAGFSAVDLASFELKLLGETFVTELLAANALGLASLIHIDRFLTGSEREQCLDRTLSMLDAAKRLGSATFMLVAEPHEGANLLSAEEIYKTLTEAWQPVAERAVRYGITPVMEDYPDLSLHLSRLNEVKEMLRRVKGLKLVYDSANMVFGGEDPVTFLRGMPQEQIGHVHLKDIAIRAEHVQKGERLADGRRVDTVFTGTGIIDLPAVLKQLRERNYSGYYAVEFAPKEGISRAAALAEAKEYIERIWESCDEIHQF